jgi:hypothetical protein
MRSGKEGEAVAVNENLSKSNQWLSNEFYSNIKQ